MEFIGNSLLSFFEQAKDKKMRASINAVSYTHLRAHETVLDLVCRLLLEKKKNQRSITDHHCNTK